MAADERDKRATYAPTSTETPSAKAKQPTKAELLSSALASALGKLDLRRMDDGGCVCLTSGRAVGVGSREFGALVRRLIGDDEVSDKRIARAVDLLDPATLKTYEPPRRNEPAPPERSETNFERGDEAEIAEHLLAALRGTGPALRHDEGDLYRYADTGLWSVVGVPEQARTIKTFAGSLIPTERGEKALLVSAHATKGAIELAGYDAHSPSFFTDAPRGLAFTNGFLRVTAEGPVLVPHAPENGARLSYQFAYVRNAAPVPFLKFMDSVWRDDEDRDEKVMFAQEFFGAALLGIAPKFQRCALAKGGGANGKSAFGDIIVAVMPVGSVAAVSPQNFDSEYRRHQLAGKLLNLVNELPDADIEATECFKAIVVGNGIDARGIYKAPYTLHPKAAHYFATNWLPGTCDASDAFFRRWVVLTFNRSFEGDPECDPDIASKVVAACTPQMVSWLVEGAVRLMRTGKYTIPPSSDELALREWRRTADAVSQFLSEHTRPAQSPRPTATGAHDWTAARALYLAYTAWAQANGHKSLASNKFGARAVALLKVRHETQDGTFYPVTLVPA